MVCTTCWINFLAWVVTTQIRWSHCLEMFKPASYVPHWRSNKIRFIKSVLLTKTILCFFFPGGKGDRANHRGSDHEKGHATGFYQVSSEGSLFPQLYLDEIIFFSRCNPLASLRLSFPLLFVVVMACCAQAKVRHGMLSASCPDVT